MLPYYSPFKVAEQFLMLEALFPNRVDLGVGRAPGGDMRTAQAVAAGDYNRGDIFPQQVADLVGLFNGTLPDDHIAQRRAAAAADRHASRTVDARFQRLRRLARGAARHPLRVRAFHQRAVRASRGARRIASASRRATKQQPYLAAAVFVICADTDEEAAALEKAVDLRRVQMAYGLNMPIPSIEQGAAQHYGERELNVIAREKNRSIIGTPERVTARTPRAAGTFRRR